MSVIVVRALSTAGMTLYFFKTRLSVYFQTIFPNSSYDRYCIAKAYLAKKFIFSPLLEDITASVEMSLIFFLLLITRVVSVLDAYQSLIRDMQPPIALTVFYNYCN